MVESFGDERSPKDGVAVVVFKGCRILHSTAQLQPPCFPRFFLLITTFECHHTTFECHHTTSRHLKVFDFGTLIDLLTIPRISQKKQD